MSQALYGVSKTLFDSAQSVEDTFDSIWSAGYTLPPSILSKWRGLRGLDVRARVRLLLADEVQDALQTLVLLVVVVVPRDQESLPRGRRAPILREAVLSRDLCSATTGQIVRVQEALRGETLCAILVW